MKTTVLTLIGVATLSLAGACTHKEQPQPEKTVFVYTFERPAVMDSNDSKKLIERFLGARDVGDLYKSSDNTLYYVSKTDVSETFEHDINNGNFTYNKSMKKYTGDYVPQLPGKEDATKLAEEFLSKNALLPRNRNELKLVHFGGLRASTVIDGKKAGPVIDEMVTINYARVIDNTPVIGPGSKIVVKLGDKGEVMGVIRRWRELVAGSRKPVQPQEMIYQQEAEEMARRQVMTEYGEGTSYRILGSGRAYYDNNGSILQPVYTFEVAISLQDQKVSPFNYLCVVPTLRNSPEPLNLTAVDPRAKEMIKSIKRGERPSPRSERQPID
jgi:hypothetical protein